MKYRKKPVVIEAFQFTASSARFEWPLWAQEAGERGAGENGIWLDGDAWYCGTLEGVHEITFDDYIIQGIKGEIYPCKPDIFEATYEKVMSHETNNRQ